MSKQYQVKQVETNKRGYKVTRTISTEDVEEIKSLIGTTAPSSSTPGKTAKASTDKKTAKASTKKGVVIDAEFTEVKPSKSTTKTSKKAKEKPKALPAPAAKKKESKPKKEPKKPSSGTKTNTQNKKAGVCIFKDKTGRFSAYQEVMGFSLYDKNSCVQQLIFETDASKALKVFSEKIKQILAEDKKRK